MKNFDANVRIAKLQRDDGVEPLIIRLSLIPQPTHVAWCESTQMPVQSNPFDLVYEGNEACRMNE